jgi:hypothetical protein
MASLLTLKRQAGAGARWRGHKLGKWQSPTGWADDRAYAECGNAGCHASVSVDVTPAPNGIDIGGSAVAVNCPDTEE